MSGENGAFVLRSSRRVATAQPATLSGSAPATTTSHQTFIAGLRTDPEDSAIVTACMRLAHALGLSVIAEGVETPVQLHELRALGCEFAQGRLFAMAQTAERLGNRPAEEQSWEMAGLSATRT